MTDRGLARMRAERRATERAERLDAIMAGVAIALPTVALWGFFWLVGWLMAEGVLPC